MADKTCAKHSNRTPAPDKGAGSSAGAPDVEGRQNLNFAFFLNRFIVFFYITFRLLTLGFYSMRMFMRKSILALIMRL